MAKFWRSKQAAYGEAIVSLGIGWLVTFLKPSIGIPLFLWLILFGTWLIWRAYAGNRFQRILLPLLILAALVCTSFAVSNLRGEQIKLLQVKLAELDKPFASFNELQTQSHISNRRIRLVELAVDYSLIENKVFDNVEFFGPAVIQFQDPIQQSTTITIVADIGDTLDSIYIASPNERLTGVIGFRNVILNNVRFRHVGIIGKPDVIEILKAKAHIINEVK